MSIGMCFNDDVPWGVSKDSEERKLPIAYNDILETFELLRKQPIRTGPLKFYTAGTGFTDEFIVDWFKDTGIIVVTRDGKEWINGIPVSE